MVAPKQIEIVDILLDDPHLEIVLYYFTHDSVFRMIDIHQKFRMPEFVGLLSALFILLLGLLSEPSTLG